MTRQEAVDMIISDGIISIDHKYKDDILFYIMLRDNCAEIEWYEVSELCNTQILHIKNKQKVDNLLNQIRK